MKNNGRLAIIILGYLAVLTALAYLIFFICAWISGRAGSGGGMLPVSADGMTLQDGRLILSQEDLDSMLSNAQEQAATKLQEQQEEALLAAADSGRAEVLSGIRTDLEAGGNTMVEVLRPYYPDDIVVVSNGRFHFVPINRELKLNGYTEENLKVLENGEFQYQQDDQIISHKGIDVSSHQGKIDWKAVAEDGVEFAIIRVGYRGYGSAGKLVTDERFDANMEGALAAGIKVGVYFFSQAITAEEALEEAELVLEKLAPYQVKCPVVYDVEKTANSGGRMNQLSLEERTNYTLQFCQTIENAGYKPMIYHNMEMATLMIDLETLENYEKWFAYYNSNLYYPYEYKIWQYSDKGKVKGINTDVDLDISFYAFWEE